MKVPSHFTTQSPAYFRGAAAPSPQDDKPQSPADKVELWNEDGTGPDDMAGLRMLAGGMAGAVAGLGTVGVSMAKGAHPVVGAILGCGAAGLAIFAAREGVNRLVEQQS